MELLKVPKNQRVFVSDFIKSSPHGSIMPELFGDKKDFIDGVCGTGFYSGFKEGKSWFYWTFIDSAQLKKKDAISFSDLIIDLHRESESKEMYELSGNLILIISEMKKACNYLNNELFGEGLFYLCSELGVSMNGNEDVDTWKL